MRNVGIRKYLPLIALLMLLVAGLAVFMLFSGGKPATETAVVTATPVSRTIPSPPSITTSPTAGATTVAPVVSPTTAAPLKLATKPGFLATDGGQLKDSKGNVVRLTGVNWYGLETTRHSLYGLDERSMSSILDQIKSLGYNMLRVPFCTELLNPGVQLRSISNRFNPDLVKLDGLQLIDKLVEGAGERGLKVILDRHNPGCNNEKPALWYSKWDPEQRWIDDWKKLAAHYLNNPTVIGFDLTNEPYSPATWGDANPETDWRLAAERAGNAILSVNPDLLIIVEGLDKFGDESYWRGGNLLGAKAFPVRLNVANRLVYSIHDYPASVHPQPWFSSPDYPDNLPALWDKMWGYLFKGNTAPVLIGELGTKNQTASDQKWFRKLADYIKQNGLSFAYWSFNPESEDTGGILQSDWQTVNQDKQDILQPILAPPVN